MVGTSEERQLRSYQPAALFHQHQRETGHNCNVCLKYLRQLYKGTKWKPTAWRYEGYKGNT